MKILHIDSSINGDRSVSKKLSKKIVEAIQEKYPSSIVVYHDFGANPLKTIDEKFVQASYTQKGSRTKEQEDILKKSDELITEIKNADCIVIGCPMYNFSISANLKIWVDYITRKYETFSDKNEGLVHEKKEYIVMTRGGGDYEQGKKLHFLNGQSPSILAPLSFIGINDVQLLLVDNCASKNFSFEQAAEQINNLSL